MGVEWTHVAQNRPVAWSVKNVIPSFAERMECCLLFKMDSDPLTPRRTSSLYEKLFNFVRKNASRDLGPLVLDVSKTHTIRHTLSHTHTHTHTR